MTMISMEHRGGSRAPADNVSASTRGHSLPARRHYGPAGLTASTVCWSALWLDGDRRSGSNRVGGACSCAFRRSHDRLICARRRLPHPFLLKGRGKYQGVPEEPEPEPG